MVAAPRHYSDVKMTAKLEKTSDRQWHQQPIQKIINERDGRRLAALAKTAWRQVRSGVIQRRRRWREPSMPKRRNDISEQLKMKNIN